MTNEEETNVEEVPSQELQEQEINHEEGQQDSVANAKASPDHWQAANQALRFQKQKIEELERRLTEKEKQVVEEEPDEFADLDPEDYVKVGKARQIAERIAEKKAMETARKVVQEYSQQQSLQSDEQRMRSRHEDYDYVVENFAIPLIKNDPALAYRIQSSKNPAETAYKLGKLSDEFQEESMKQQVSPKAERILKNASRPVSSNASVSPLKNQSEQFSKMSREDVWAQSQKYARGA